MKDYIESIRTRDPANPTMLEVALCYPGFHAMTVFYPLSHWMWQRGWRVPARIWAHIGRCATGIEIHPGAKIGKNLFIDHGMGVVIGETATIGDDVLLYHGVTLGGRGGETGKRHPDIGDCVTIGAGAQILGAIQIGQNSAIGANTVVTASVPPNVTVAGNPARVIGKRSGHCPYGIDETAMADPVAETISGLVQDVEKLKSGKTADTQPADYAERWKGSGI